jgi:hypothetical protein
MRRDLVTRICQAYSNQGFESINARSAASSNKRANALPGLLPHCPHTQCMDWSRIQISGEIAIAVGYLHYIFRSIGLLTTNDKLLGFARLIDNVGREL